MPSCPVCSSLLSWEDVRVTDVDGTELEELGWAYARCGHCGAYMELDAAARAPGGPDEG